MLNGRGCASPRHRPSASVVLAIDRFNSLFRFVQQSGQRCNGYLPTRDIDSIDDSRDRRDKHFTSRPVDHVDIVRAGLQHVDCAWRWRGFALLTGRSTGAWVNTKQVHPVEPPYAIEQLVFEVKRGAKKPVLPLRIGDFFL